MKLKSYIILICLFVALSSGFAQNTRKFELSLYSNYTPYVPTGSTPEFHTSAGHSGGISNIAWSNDGKYIASSSSSDKTVRIWDSTSGKELKILQNSESPSGICWTPDGKNVVVATGECNVLFWDILSGSVTKTIILDNNANEVMYSPDASMVFFFGTFEKNLYIYDSATYKKLKKLDCDNSEIRYAVWSPDSKYIATLSKDKIVRIWDIKMKLPTVIQTWNADYIYGISWSKKNHILSDGIVREAFTGKEIQRIDGDSYGVSYSPDGNYIAMRANCVFSYSELWIWDSNTGKLLYKKEHRGSGFCNYNWSPDSKSFVIGSNIGSSHIGIIDMKTGGEKVGLGIEKPVMPYSAFTPDGKEFASATRGKVTIWKSSTFKKESEFECYGGNFSIHPNGKTIVSCSKDKENIQSYDIESETLTNIAKLQFDEESLKDLEYESYDTNFSWSPDGKYLAINLYPKIYIYSGATLKRLEKLEGDILAFSPSGKYFATEEGKWEEAKTIKIYKTDDWKLYKSIEFPAKNDKGYANVVFDIAWGKDDKTIAIIDDRGVHLWDIHSQNYTTISNNPSQHNILWTTDGKYIVTKSNFDGNISVLDGKNGKKICSMNTGSALVNDGKNESLAMNANGDKLVSVTVGASIQVWDFPSGKLLSSTIADDSGDYLTYTPEGYFTGSPGGINKFVHLVDGMQVFELGQMYDTLYRPDLVQAKLEGKDIGKPVLKDIVATGDAPRVQFVGSPLATNRNVKLEFSVQDSGGGIGYVYLSQNGKAMQVSAGEESKTGRKFIYTCDVTLAAGENVFEAYAANSANKIESRHISLSLNWQGKVEKSNLYVLAMGVDKYTKMPKNNLRYSVADATAIIESFKTAPGGLYSSVNVMTLLDSDVNKANIENAFDVFSAKVKPDDMFVLHIAGHGVNYGGEYYYLPADTFAKTDADFAKQGISKHFLTENLSKLQALNMVVLLDTCYSGAFIDTNAKGNALAQQTALEHLQHTSGQVILTGASNTQTAGEGYNGHGIFTYAILEALSGKANYNADGAVSIKEITQYIGYEIPNIYEKMGFDRQSPWNSLIRGDFSLVAYGNKSPSLSKDVSLKDNKKDIVWVSKRIVEGSALFDSMAKKIDKSDDGVYKKSDSYKLTKTASAEFFGKSKEINFNAGYSKGTIFEGLSLGAGFYFFGNQHIFAGVGCDFIFSSLIGKYEDETDVQKMTFANMNAIFGLSANIGHFRPFVQTGFGGYVVSVPDSNTDTSVFSFSAHGAVGSDIVFGKFFIGGLYRLYYYDGSGFVDNYVMNIGWNW